MNASIFPWPSWNERSSFPPLHIFASTKSAAPRASATQSALPNTRPATASPRTINPFHPASTLSSRPGFTRSSRALLGGHLPPHVLRRLLHGLLPQRARLQPRLVRLGVERQQLRVVVEHLLEVRHQPPLVHRVPVEPAAQLVVHTAARHPLQRER